MNKLSRDILGDATLQIAMFYGGVRQEVFPNRFLVNV